MSKKVFPANTSPEKEQSNLGVRKSVLHSDTSSKPSAQMREIEQFWFCGFCFCFPLPRFMFLNTII